MKHRVLSRIPEGAFRYQGWPTVAKRSDGTFLVGASGHRRNHLCPFGANLMYQSQNEGETWSLPMLLRDSWLDDRDVGLVCWGEGNVLMSSFTTSPASVEKWAQKADTRPQYSVCSPLSAGMREEWKALPDAALPYGSYTMLSRDGGNTWTAPRPAPVSSPHGPCRLSDGRLLYIGSYVSQGEYEAPVPLSERIRVYESHNDGESWEFLSCPPIPDCETKGFYEPHALMMANGDLLAVVRVESNTAPSMPNLRLYTVLSHDLGKTWEEPVLLDLSGAPGHLCQHSSGAVILTYSCRQDPGGEYVRISHDFGKTWSKDQLISPEMTTWDHGYPSTVECENGDLFTVYYAPCPGDRFASLHSVRWSLEEIE